MDRHVTDKEVALSAGLLVRGRETFVRDRPPAEGAVELGSDDVLHHGASVLDTRRPLLTLFRLIENVARTTSRRLRDASSLGESGTASQRRIPGRARSRILRWH